MNKWNTMFRHELTMKEYRKMAMRFRVGDRVRIPARIMERSRDFTAHVTSIENHFIVFTYSNNMRTCFVFQDCVNIQILD